MNRQNALIETNIRWLRQALRLLDRLDDTAYATTPPGLEPHRARAPLRHIVEFYQSFLSGVESFYIDYDARRRDQTVERSRAAAGAAIRSIIRSLETCAALLPDTLVWVRMEDAAAANDAWMP